MATYYISPIGSDSAPGTYADPWSTFTKAAAVAGPDDTVVAKNGTYVFGGSQGSYWQQINQGGTAGHPVIYTAETPGSVVFDGNYNARAIILLGLSASHHPDNITIEYLELKKNYWQALIYNPDVAASGNNIIIRHCHLHHAGQRLEYSDYPTMVQGISALYSGANSNNWLAEKNLIHDIGRLNPELSGNPLGWPSDYTHNWKHDHGWYAKGLNHVCANNIFYNYEHGFSMTMGCTAQFLSNTLLGPVKPGVAGAPLGKLQVTASSGSVKIENNLAVGLGSGYLIWFCQWGSGEIAGTVRNNICDGTLYNTSDGGSLATNHISGVTFSGNLPNTVAGLVKDGTPYKFLNRPGIMVPSILFKKFWMPM